MRKLFAGFILIIATASVIQAQDERFGLIGKHSIEANYQFGRIVPHNSKFTTKISGFTHAVEVNYYYQTLGEKAWQRKMRYPEVGGSFYFAYNGDQKYFGNVYSILMAAKFWIVRSRYIDFFARVATGPAITPTHYNIVTNPENHVIGSLINCQLQLRLGIDVKPHPQVQVSTGLTFTHYSNAAVQQPNLGINQPALVLGVRYFPVVDKKYKYDRSPWGKPEKKNEFGFRLSVGVHENLPFNGPKYPIYIGTFHYARYTSHINKVIGGLSTEFNQAAYDFYGFAENNTRFSRTGAAFNLSVFAGDEVLVGKIGMMFLAGAYVFNPRKDTPVYVKLGVNYYFVSVGKSKNVKFYIGSYLKSHFFVAQNWEGTAGVTF